MQKRTIVLLELGMLVGLLVSMFVLPPTMEFSTFLAIAGFIFLVGNVLLFRSAKRSTVIGVRRTSASVFLPLGFFVLYCILRYLWR